MKKTRLFVSAFVGMMLVATAAYAWFTFSTPINGNKFGAGTLKIKTYGGPIDASGLMPGGDANISYMAVENIGSAPAHLRGFLSNVVDDKGIARYLNVKVVMVPDQLTLSFPGRNVGSLDWKGPEAEKVIFDGKLAGLYYGSLTNTLTTLKVENTPNTAAAGGLPVGKGAIYRIEVSLDEAAPNEVQGASMTANFTWAAGQVSRSDSKLAASAF